jgi:hypothetical protein
VRVEQRHLDERLRLRVVIDEEDADVTQIERWPYGTGHAGAFGFLDLLQYQSAVFHGATKGGADR